MILDYKTFNPRNFSINNIDDCVKVLDMFADRFNSKECSMSERDEKWGLGLMFVSKFLKQQRGLKIE